MDKVDRAALKGLLAGTRASDPEVKAESANPASTRASVCFLPDLIDGRGSMAPSNCYYRFQWR
jgi:hypothetical protein